MSTESLAVRVLCRHCPSSISPAPDGTWRDPGGGNCCDTTWLPHQPLPASLRGGARS